MIINYYLHVHWLPKYIYIFFKTLCGVIEKLDCKNYIQECDLQGTTSGNITLTKLVRLSVRCAEADVECVPLIVTWICDTL